jgi:serine/threonine protein kinase
MTMSDDSFAQLVIEQGWLSADQLQHAFSSVEELRRAGVEIDLRGWMLVRGLVTNEQIERASGVSPPTPERPLGYDYLGRLPAHAGSIQEWVVAHQATGRRGVLRFAVEPAGTRFGLRNEARILAKLAGCSEAPRVLDSGEQGHFFFLELDLPEATTLFDLLQLEQPIPLVEVCCIGRDLARGLQAIHAAGVSWRNLKPSSVWRVGDGWTFFDFSVSCLDSDTWIPGELVGTTDYLAPEQIEGEHAPSSALDRYALGVVLYQLITGSVPYPADPASGLPEKIRKIVGDPVPDPKALRPDCRGALARLVRDLLAKRPSDRPRDLTKVAGTLDDLTIPTLASIPDTTPAAPVVPVSPEPGWPKHTPTRSPSSAVAPESLNLNLIQSVDEIQTNALFRPAALAHSAPSSRPRSVAESASMEELGSIRMAPDWARPAALPDKRPGAGAHIGMEDRAARLDDSNPSGFEDYAGRPTAPPAADRVVIRAGTKMGPFKIIDMIGQGTFGEVYLAEDTKSVLGTRVALKLPKQQRLGALELVGYQREAKLWKALSAARHPNVLELIDLQEYSGVIAFVMEYVDGPDLYRLARERGSFPLSEVVRIILAVIDALKVIHSKRVFHGDLKPSNILIRTEDGAVKVTDFSLSRSVTSTGLAEQAEVAGTIPYMAPEVWRGKTCLQSDIFSLGVMFYELMTGKRPFAGSTEQELKANVLAGEIVEPPSGLRPDLSHDVERIILRCLETAVEDRYGSVAELAEDLQNADTSRDLVARLADCVIEGTSEEDLAFMVEHDLPSKGYRGSDARSIMIEYCLGEDPTQVLSNCFNKPGLARLARKLGADLEGKYADADQYAQAILRQLGLATSGAPRGIRDSIARVSNLRHLLAQTHRADEVAEIALPASREYEKILRDLIRFYGHTLFGRFYERSLVRVARKRIADSKRDLSRATLGDLVAVLDALNDHLRGDSAEARYFSKTFRRDYAVPPALLKESGVIRIRNMFAHSHESLAASNLVELREKAEELVAGVVDFLQSIERDGIYPRVVAVESFVTDCFGRKYVFCRNDEGHREKVFTNVTIDPSRHYFFYPTTSSTSVYPILVPT